MSSSRLNALDQQSISGTTNQSSSLNLSDEALGLGATISGQTGISATISSFSNSIITLTDISGFTANDVGNYITISNANTLANNGTFLITVFNSSTSIGYKNVSGHFPDTNSGSINWIERFPYSIQDDLNYIRTDRSAIKGLSYTSSIPTYQNPNNIGINIPANLTNIAGKTTDAVAYVQKQQFLSATTIVGNIKTTINNTNNLKHANAVNTIGVPCFDTAPFINDIKSCYTKITDGSITGSELSVLTGMHSGERIYGITNAGASTSPNSVEILFYSFPIIGNILTQSTQYTWEDGQSLILNLEYGYNQTLNLLDKNVFHPISTSVSPVSGSGITSSQHETLHQLIHFIESGPAHGFASGAVRVISPSGNPFPTSIVWYLDGTMTTKLVEKIITYNGSQVPTTIVWNMYDISGLTIIQTISDSIIYTSNVFETSRTRTIS